MRRAGILLPISSIPSRYGIGTFSKEAYEFVDFLQAAGQKLWQLLPLGPTGYGDSPYQSFSTFAGNPYYIDLEKLVEEGLLLKEECDRADFGGNAHYVDYEKIYRARFCVLYQAYERALANGVLETQEYVEFACRNQHWLKDYSLFMAVKNHFDGVCFIEWDEDIRLRRPEAMERYERTLQKEISFYSFLQYLFKGQWSALKQYANDRGIQIVGDIPIYVAFDSADTWANPELFQLDEEHLPLAVAGCPPDAFSSTGQLWGNPLYRWEHHARTGYDWWIRRIAYCYELYDIVRIDHFRGFDAYWSIPYGDKTAERGHWEQGPGYELFEVMKNRLGECQVIAEDLGFLTESVFELVRRTGYPGMKVLQFAFDSREDSDYLPHNYPHNCVVYTGTHDNETTAGWFDSILQEDRSFAQEYLNIRKGQKAPAWEMIRAAIASVADTAVIPMQDYLGLGNEARCNTPSTLGDNWKWRMDRKALKPALAEKIRNMTKLYGRL